MRRERTEQCIGELILYAPLILLAALLSVALPVMLAMVTFFACKWAYRTDNCFHLGKSYQCAALSYGLFLAIGLCTAGLTASSQHMSNQPMIPILAAVGATWVWANAGEWQAGYTAGKKKPFRCKTASEEEIRARCLELGKSDEYANFMIAVWRSGKLQKEIAFELKIATGTVKEYKRIRTRQLDDP